MDVVRIPAVEDVVPAAVPVVQNAHDPDRHVRIGVGQLRHVCRAVIFRVRDAQRCHKIAQIVQLVAARGPSEFNAVPGAPEFVIKAVFPAFVRFRGFPVQDLRKGFHFRNKPFHQVLRVDNGIGGNQVLCHVVAAEIADGIVDDPLAKQETVRPGILPEHFQHAVEFGSGTRKVFL